MSLTPKSIFIGGTGRCGTNILKDSLCAHPDFFGLGFESRFTIDPAGVIPTYQSLMYSWSPINLNQTVVEFCKLIQRLSVVTPTDRIVNNIEYLVRKVIPTISLRAYSHWELSKYFPSLIPLTEELVQKLVSGVYSGSWHGNNFLTRKMYLPAIDSSKHEYLTEIFALYLNELIDEILKERKCEVFVDDNTFNILYATELLRLVPNSLMIHMYRDPRDVVASYVKQRWSPTDLNHAIDYYCSIMQKWYGIKENIPKSKLVEIRFEDYVLSPYEYMNEIFSSFSVSNYSDKTLDTNVNIEQANLNRWVKEFSDSEKELLNSRLDYWLNNYGYS